MLTSATSSDIRIELIYKRNKYTNKHQQIQYKTKHKMMIIKSEYSSKTEEQIKIILPAALVGSILILVSIFILLYKICTSTLALDATPNQTANQRPNSRTTNQQTENQVRHSRVRANALRNYLTATPPPSYRSISRAQAVTTISGSPNLPPCYEIAVKNDVPPEYAYINEAFSPPEYIA